MSAHSGDNPDVLQAWCDAPSHLLPPALPASLPDSPGSSPHRHRYTPAEISQQSVDLLLREYYAMVTAQRHGGVHHQSEGSGSLLQRAFLLLLCPAAPSCLELDQLLKAAVWAVSLLCKAVVYSSVLLVPLWLGLTRQSLLDQGPAAAAAVAAGGVLVFVLCDSIHRRCAIPQGIVTAASLQHRLQAVASGQELAALRAASKTASTSNRSRPGSSCSTQQQPQQQQVATAAKQQQNAPAAAHGLPSSDNRAASSAGGGGSSNNHNTASTSYAALELDLAVVQAALGVTVSSSHAAGSREHVAEVLLRLNEQLGLPTPEATAAPATMAAQVALLKQSVGI